MAEQHATKVTQQFSPSDWRALRLARGDTLRVVADATAMNISLLSQGERGLRRLTPAQQIALARYFFGDRGK
jgi:transcriptional regulator with XRE-family HTH domain